MTSLSEFVPRVQWKTCCLYSPRLPCLLLLFGLALIGGLVMHMNGPMAMHLNRIANTTHRLISSRLHEHAMVSQPPCNATCRWLREQQRRKKRVSTVCNSYRNSSDARANDLSYTLTPQLLRTMNHFLVSDSHRLIYCYIPKVGCTNWKRVLLVLGGAIGGTNQSTQSETHVIAQKHIRTLAGYSLQAAKERLDNYTTFMFARHPFERILSGYRDKFLMDYPASTSFRRKYGPLISTYDDPRHRHPSRRSDGTLNVSFAQFARYLGDPANSFRGDDPTEHWNQMYRICHPCAVSYDIVGNFSTLHEDADFLLNLKGLDTKVSYPKSTNPTNSSDEQYLARYFANLLPGDIKALLDRYLIDFELFGYTLPSVVPAKNSPQ
ncbi:carbohydrate sulfotransferase 11-like [Acanthaster planci]|uniref:Carbohydrate sulfotransferase n=1 Tax=Acanthaster planci TaxID=133434 RepID=A0A8B7ZC25_ACAPL|nr:carbohydrate sulfotransferase 11-like [Acanthaster planci]XP_022103213.1 carbohydrate sulfotransferase 11-like [Acanthaster planci]